jgi:hypothetical protein
MIFQKVPMKWGSLLHIALVMAPIFLPIDTASMGHLRKAKTNPMSL